MPTAAPFLSEPEQSRPFSKTETVTALAAKLQPLPATLTRLAGLDPKNCDLADVADAIRMDPVLASRLMRMANSAFSAGSMKVSTVDEALARLGFGIVISLSFALSVGKRMNASVPAYGLAAGQLWRHSAAAAIAAEVLVRSARDRIPAATVTAALLHDIGKLILAQGANPAEWAAVRELQIEQGLSRHAAERAILGLDHAEVGCIVARHWGLPERICRAIMHHHSLEPWDDPIGDAVHVANLAARTIEAVANGEPPEAGPAPEVLERLDLKNFDFGKFCAQGTQRFTQLRDLYDT